MQNELLTVNDIANYFGCHICTIQRWFAEAKKGQSTFPLPITEPGKRKKWRRNDIVNWNPQGQPRPESPSERAIRNAMSKNALARHGIIIK